MRTASHLLSRWVQRIEADAVVAAVGPPPLTATAGSAIQAAQMLLAVIGAGVNLAATVRGARDAMTPEQARLALAAAAMR